MALISPRVDAKTAKALLPALQSAASVTADVLKAGRPGLAFRVEGLGFRLFKVPGVGFRV